MSNDLDPRVRQWYRHRDKGQPFYVTAVDDRNGTVEVQHFEGDVEEFTLREWDDLDIDVGEPPANWTGPQDSEDQDAQGDVTDTSEADWDANYREQHHGKREKRPYSPDRSPGGTVMTESLMEDVPESRNRNRVGNFHRRADGVYIEGFDDTWTAEYLEDAETGLWRVDMLRLDASHWRQEDFDSLEEARKAAVEFYNDATSHGGEYSG